MADENPAAAPTTDADPRRLATARHSAADHASAEDTLGFEPYVRAADGGGSRGLGLGLAICRRIVTAHGGSISVYDEPGWGSRFFFSLPAADEEAC